MRGLRFGRAKGEIEYVVPESPARRSNFVGGLNASGFSDRSLAATGASRGSAATTARACSA